MEQDHSSAINEHKTIVKQLNKKTDASVDSMKQQHAASIAKVSWCLLLQCGGYCNPGHLKGNSSW